MRTKTWFQIKTAVQQGLGTIEYILSDHATSQKIRHQELLGQLALVQPVKLDLTQELADRITEKLHGPFTISTECSNWLRGLAQHGDVLYVNPVGYTALGGSLDLRIKTNGSLYVELRDHSGQIMWRATLVPPDSGKPAATPVDP